MPVVHRRVGLFAKLGDARVRAVLPHLAAAVAARGAVLTIERETALDAGLAATTAPLEQLAGAVDLLLCVGGDGTLLAAARACAPRGVPVAGLNAGRLGFLTDLALDSQDLLQMEQGLATILEGRGIGELRDLLQAAVRRAGGMTEPAGVALNDAVIQKRDVGRMIELSTWVDGRFVSGHRADGLVVATPTGSTAYALSCGGPILHPSLDALALVPICPHTLSDRPIVVGGSCVVEVALAEGFNGAAQLTLDGQVRLEVGPGDRVLVQKSAQPLTLLHPPGHDYFDVLRTKLHWGRSNAPTHDR